MKRILALVLLLSSIAAANAKTVSDEQVWINLNTFIRFQEKWQAYLEYQPRFSDYEKYNLAVLHRGAIGRDIGNNMSLWVGYAAVTWNTRTDSKFPAKTQHEDRPFLMWMHGTKIDNWLISNRARYEFRNFRHAEEPSERFRYMFRGAYKFGDSPWAIAAWDEYFWNTNTIHPSSRSHAPVTKAGFDQNRAFIGVAYYFGEKQQHMFETGYMNNYVNGASIDRNANVWMTTVTARF